MNALLVVVAYAISKFFDGKYALLFSKTISIYSSLILVIIAVVYSWKSLVEFFRDRQTLLLGLGIYVLALLARFSIPHTMRLFFDEDIYLAMGKEILNGQSCLCAEYLGKCLNCEAMKWPPLNPMLAALSFLIGIHPRLMFIAVSSLSAVVAFLIPDKKEVGIVAGLVVALHPLLMLWNTEYSAENLLTLVVLLIILASKSAIRVVPILSALAAYAKTEGLLIFPLMAALFPRSAKREWFIAALLIIPAMVSAIYFSRVDSWGAQGSKFSVSYFLKNSIENFRFLFIGIDNPGKQLLHPALLTWMAIPAILTRKRHVIVAVAIAFSLFLLYSSFYAGSVLYGVDVRYMLPVVAIISVLSAVTAGRISEKVSEISLFKNHSLMKLVRLVIVLLPLIITVSYIAASHHILLQKPKEIEEAKQAREYRDFVLSNIDMLKRENCTVISHVAAIYRWNDLNTLQAWMIETNRGLIESLDGCVVFDYGFWCGIEPYSSVCEKYKSFNHSIIDISPSGRYYLMRIWNTKKG